MGCSFGQHSASLPINRQKSIIIATLNYGGILNSPFEFYSDNETQQRGISETFKQLIPEYFPDFDSKFKWNVGKIDQKIQNQRFTPIYNSSVGVQDNKLVNKEQFMKSWDEAYAKAIQKTKVQPEPTPQQIQTMKTFDLICYHALLRYTSKVKGLEESQISKINPKSYKKLCEEFFSRSYLNEEKKIQKVIEALQQHDADIFCFQEPTEKFIAVLRKDPRFQVRQKGPDVSMVVVKKSSFKEIPKKDVIQEELTTDQLELLNWNKDTSYIVVDKYIVLSGHLSSKKQKNAKEVKQMKDSLNVLRKKLPEYGVIVGADTNSFVTAEELDPSFKIYPHQKHEFTTCKKRTFVQPQFHKANEVNQECKDQVLTTLNAAKHSVMTIDGKQIKDSFLLPTDSHPFDHFMLVVYLEKK